MKIMVFLHGTVIMHRAGLDRTRDERVQQVLEEEATVRDFASYVPIGRAVEKLRAWRRQGADIVYLSSHPRSQDLTHDRAVLREYGFPEGPVYHRRSGESYGKVVERVFPDVLIEDDCESIGGEAEMASPHIRPPTRAKIKAIVAREFGGIDHLPDELAALIAS